MIDGDAGSDVDVSRGRVRFVKKELGLDLAIN